MNDMQRLNWLHGELTTLRARVAELDERAERYRLTTLRQDATIAELVVALREVMGAMRRYEVDVSCEVEAIPSAHVQMMKRAEQALARAESATPKEVQP